MKQLIEKESLSSYFNFPNPGDMVKGKVLAKQRSSIFVDLGILGTGIIKRAEMPKTQSIFKHIEIGDEISATLLVLDNKNGYSELSLSKAQEKLNWQDLKKKKENNESFSVTVSKANRGGLIAMIDNISGFLPVSQLKPEHYPKVENGDQTKILQKLQQFIGEKIKVTILSLDQKENTLILSEKASDMKKTQESLKKYKVGDIVNGEITGVVDFGGFIRFPLKPKDGENSIEGLIHISELDWRLIQNPLEIIKPGEKVEAKIIEISNGRVSLSLRALKKNPWEDAEKEYKKGDVISGKIIKFNPFGAFVEIGPVVKSPKSKKPKHKKDKKGTSQIQGLIHISEFHNEEDMKEQLEIGKAYHFQILLIEPKEHRIILRLTPKEKK